MKDIILQMAIFGLISLVLLFSIASTHGFSGVLEGHELSQESTSNIIARNKRAATVGLIDIAQFADSSPAGKAHIVYVDDTMTRLIFQVTVYHSNPVIMANTPAKIPCAVRPSLSGDPAVGDGKVVATLDIPITSTADYGFWQFSKLDSNKWYVKIQGESPVSIKQQLFELGTSTPISGNPITGISYKLVITTVGFSNIKSGDMAFLFTRENVSPLGMASLTDNGKGIYEAASVKMPAKTFMVCLQGKDNSNKLFRRLDTTEIVPVTLDLSVPPYAGATIMEYQTFNITFVVTNLLQTTQDIDVRIEDSRNYAQAPKFLSSTLKVGENFTGTFLLKVQFSGLTTSVKIVARQYFGSGQFSPGPEEQRNFTVISNKTTVAPVTTTTVASNTKSSPAAGATQNVARQGSTSGTASSNISNKSSGSGSSGLASTFPPGVTGPATTNTQKSVSGSSTVASVHDNPTEQPDDSTDDEESMMAVSAVVALSIAGMVGGALIGAGAAGTAVVLHKKVMAKKVAALQQEHGRGHESEKNKLTPPVWR